MSFSNSQIEENIKIIIETIEQQENVHLDDIFVLPKSDMSIFDNKVILNDKKLFLIDNFALINNLLNESSNYLVVTFKDPEYIPSKNIILPLRINFVSNCKSGFSLRGGLLYDYLIDKVENKKENPQVYYSLFKN